MPEPPLPEDTPAGAAELSAGAAQAVSEWAALARDLEWLEPFETAFDPSTPAGRWFVGGRLNVAVNCLDRHLSERATSPAIHWEGEPGDRRTITYRDLHAEVVAFSRALRNLGVERGDRVAVYMGWLPETVVAMLACARVGAIYALLPGVLPAEAVAERLMDLEPKVVITQDGAWRRGVMLPLKAQCDEAVASVSSVQHTIVVRRSGVDVIDFEGDRWYDEIVYPLKNHAHNLDDELGQPESVSADHPLSIMYIANRRGRPRGILHRSAGLLLFAKTMHRHGFAAEPDDLVWCAVDFSWVLGQCHALFGPLANGATTVVYEGTLDTPNHARAWEVIERYQVNTLVTTPSIVCNIRTWVDSPPGARVQSVKKIVTAETKLDDDTREWLEREIGHRKAEVAIGWTSTELGGAVRVRPWYDEHKLPDPGLAIIDDDDNALGVPDGAGGWRDLDVHGELALLHPWPSLTLGVHIGKGEHRFDTSKGSALLYRTGEIAFRSSDDHLIWLDGRKEPLISVAAQLVSATEIVEALEEHPFVRRAEVVGRADRRRGQAVLACVMLEQNIAPNSTIATELRTHVHDMLGGLSTPRAFAFCESLPADVPRPLLRAALQTLCAHHSAPSFRLTAADISQAIVQAAASIPPPERA